VRRGGRGQGTCTAAVPDLGRCTKRDRGRSEEGPAGALFASTGARAWSEPASGRTTDPEPLAPTFGDSKWKRITATSDRLYHGVEIRCGGAGGSCTGLGDVGEPIATPAPTPAGGQGFPGRTEESNAAGGTERKERRRAAPQPCRSATTSLGGRAAAKKARGSYATNEIRRTVLPRRIMRHYRTSESARRVTVGRSGRGPLARALPER
jgi:hypothetical protein